MSTLQEIIRNLEENAPMQLKQIVLAEVGKWAASEKIKSMRQGQLYYKVKNKIKDEPRTMIGAGGVKEPVTNLADWRIPSGFVRKLVDQKTGYSLSKEMNVQTDSPSYAAYLETVFDRNFQRILPGLGRDAINKGIGWLHLYYDEQGELKRKRIKPEEVIAFWADEDHTELTMLIRFYDTEEYTASAAKIITNYELWTKQGVLRFRSDDTEVPNDYTYHWYLPVLDANGNSVIDQDTGDEIREGYNWERIPFIPFKYNSEEQPLIEMIKEQIDAYDKTKSSLVNDVIDLPEQIIALYNYSGTNLSEFRYNLALYRAVMLEKMGESADSGIDTISTPIEINARQFTVELLRNDIYEFGRGVDTQADKFATAPSGEAQKYLYADLDMDADTLESEFQFALEQMLWFYDIDAANRGIGSFEDTPVTFIFNRDVSINITETVENLVKSDYLSLETRVSQNPYVDDSKAEMLRIKAEKEEDEQSLTSQIYPGLVNNTDPNVNGADTNENQ